MCSACTVHMLFRSRMFLPLFGAFIGVCLDLSGVTGLFDLIFCGKWGFYFFDDRIYSHTHKSVRTRTGQLQHQLNVKSHLFF